MIRYIAVAGTHGIERDEDWDSPESPFNSFLAMHGIEPLVISPLKRYKWSTAIDGIDNNNYTWDAAGRALAHYIIPPLGQDSLLKPTETFIISHSHGGNVVAYACGKYGLKVDGLITVATPIRNELKDLYEAATANVCRHLHLHAGWRDYMQILGSMFDGKFGLHRKHPYARNAAMPGGHGSILRDKELFPYWLDKGWLDYFSGKSVPN